VSLEHRGLRHSLSRPSLDHVARDQKRTELRLSDGLVVEGLIHLPPGTRPLDFLNRSTEAFIAVTNATVHLGERVEETAFLAINKAHIICVRDLAGGA